MQGVISPRFLCLLIILSPWCFGAAWSDEGPNRDDDYLHKIEEHETSGGGSLHSGSGASTGGTEDQINLIKESNKKLKEICYQDVKVSTPFIYRDYRSGQIKDPLRMQHPVEFVVIRDGGNPCHSKKDCMRQILSTRINSTSPECELRENFYVGGDGSVYEGRGWDVASFWHLKGIRNQSITVMFLGTFHNATPTQEAQSGFESAIIGGVWTQKILPEYKIVSMREILSDRKYLGDALQHSLKNWEGQVNVTVPMSRWDFVFPGRLKFVFRRQWNASVAKERFHSVYHPVWEVAVSNGGFRCYTRKECISQIKEEQERYIHQYGDLLENFYVGDDGSVYEGRGWKVSSHWQLGGWSTLISVRFMGNFQTELPSVKALSAFKSLVNTGIGLVKLKPEFSLISLRLAYNDSDLLGDALTRYVEMWTPWKNKYNAMSTRELMAKRLVPILNQEFWRMGSTKYSQFKNITAPIRNVIITDGGDFCYTHLQCRDLMNSEKSNHTKKYGDLLHNFYIASDGSAYEGRGWDFLPHLRLTGLNNSYITVKFLGTFSHNTPNDITLKAFNALIKHGVHAGIISPGYHFYSYRHIYDEPSYLGDALSKYLEASEHWSRSWARSDDSERAASGLLPLMLRKDWNADSPFKNFGDAAQPIDFVIVGQVGNRCFKLEKCILEMQAEQNKTMPLFGDVPDNFYIGMDGNAYEGKGWMMDPYSSGEGVERKSISVSFFGRFENDLPSNLAMAAFRRLMKYGINTGKLAEGYKIVSERQIYNYSEFVGEAFHKSIMTWDKWIGNLDASSPLQRKSSPRLMMVPRLGSNIMHRYVPERSHGMRPVEYIIVSNSGRSCFNREECGSMVPSIMIYPKYSGYVDNFFITEDGFVYEGLGWDLKSIFNMTCANCSFLKIVFLGTYDKDSPAENITDTFDFLVKWGVSLGKISPDFRVLSIRQLCENTTDISDGLHHHITIGQHWFGNSALTADCNPKKNLISTEEWKGFSIRGLKRYYLPVEEIFVLDRGERCYSKAQCTELMITEHLETQSKNGGVLENFYIGDDGNVYEGRGWGRRPYSEFRSGSKSINVLFFGDFHQEPPSKTAVSAFENIIIKQGMLIGLLSPDYSLHAVPDGKYVTDTGRKLKEYIRSWNKRRQ